MSKRVVVSGRLVDTPEPVQLPDWARCAFCVYAPTPAGGPAPLAAARRRTAH